MNNSWRAPGCGALNLSRVVLVALLASAALFASAQAFADPRGTQTTGQEALPPTPSDVWLRRLVGRYKFEGTVHAIAKGDCAPLPPDPARQDQTSEAPPEPYCRSVKGTGDCAGVGKGPGVQCVLNVFWQDMYEMVLQKSDIGAETVDNTPTGVFEIPAGYSYLDPAMALFGMDPGNTAIGYLLVDNKGMPEGGIGRIAGNRATFKTRCVNEATLLAAMNPENINERRPDTCARTVYFDARPDSKVVLVTMSIDINDELYTQVTITMRRQVDETAAPAKPAAASMPTKPAKK